MHFLSIKLFNETRTATWAGFRVQYRVWSALLLANINPLNYSLIDFSLPLFWFVSGHHFLSLSVVLSPWNKMFGLCFSLQAVFETGIALLTGLLLVQIRNYWNADSVCLLQRDTVLTGPSIYGLSFSNRWRTELHKFVCHCLFIECVVLKHVWYVITNTDAMQG